MNDTMTQTEILEILEDENKIIEKTFIYKKCELTGDLGFIEDVKDPSYNFTDTFIASIDENTISHDFLEHSNLGHNFELGSLSNELIAVALMCELRNGWHNRYNNYIEIKKELVNLFSEIMERSNYLDIIDIHKFDNDFENDYKEYNIFKNHLDTIKKISKEIKDDGYYYNYDYYLNDHDFEDNIENLKQFKNIQRDYLKSCLNALKIGSYQFVNLYENLTYDSRYIFNQTSLLIKNSIKYLDTNEYLNENNTTINLILTKNHVISICNYINYIAEENDEDNYEEIETKFYLIESIY